jgi:hypothetical protein
MARIPLSIDTPYAAVSPPQLPQRPLQIGEVFLPHPVQYYNAISGTNKTSRLFKIYLNETYWKVRIGKYLPDNFPIQNGLKQGVTLAPLIFNIALEHAIRKVQQDTPTSVLC